MMCWKHGLLLKAIRWHLLFTKFKLIRKNYSCLINLRFTCFYLHSKILFSAKSFSLCNFVVQSLDITKIELSLLYTSFYRMFPVLFWYCQALESDYFSILRNWMKLLDFFFLTWGGMLITETAFNRWSIVLYCFSQLFKDKKKSLIATVFVLEDDVPARLTYLWNMWVVIECPDHILMLFFLAMCKCSMKI